MFYRPHDGHGLPHNPFSAIVSPRPIAWISSRSRDGVDNLAPYSFFNALAYSPPQVIFGSTSDKSDRPRGKDTLANIEQSGEFCVNIVANDMRNAMNATSASLGAHASEFDSAGIEGRECCEIACRYVAGAPAALECQLIQVIDLKGPSNYAVLGEVVGVHLRDDCLDNGRFDVTVYEPLARLGYRDYAVINSVFELDRPGD